MAKNFHRQVLPGETVMFLGYASQYVSGVSWLKTFGVYLFVIGHGAPGKLV